MFCSASCTIPNCPRPNAPVRDNFKSIPLAQRIEALWKDERCRDVMWLEADNREKQSSVAEETGVLDGVASGSVYRDLVTRLGGPSEVRDDFFILFSADGFQAFKNSRHSVTIMAALSLNLPADRRYMCKNMIPVAFVPGPKEPKQLESFMLPFISEVLEINRSGGVHVSFVGSNGVLRSLHSRVFVVYQAADLQGIPKFAGNLGPSADAACHVCNPATTKSAPGKSTSYFPTHVRDARGAVEEKFDPEHVPYRTDQSIEAVYKRIEDLEMNPGRGSKKALNDIRYESGISHRPLLACLETFSLQKSIPLDLMHLYMNILERLLDVYTGKESCCSREKMEAAQQRSSKFSFILSEEAIREINGSYVRGEPCCIFSTLPEFLARPTKPFSKYASFKASESKEFILNYGTSLLYGHLDDVHLKGWCVFKNMVEVSYRTKIPEVEVKEMEALAVDFTAYMEKSITFGLKERCEVMRLVMHLPLHLGRSTRQCGPLVNVSQFWLERFIGYFTDRLNAKTRPAPSMTESALLSTAVGIVFPETMLVEDSSKEDAAALEMLADSEGRIVKSTYFRSAKNAPLLESKAPTFNLSDARNASHTRLLHAFIKRYLKSREPTLSAEEVKAVLASTIVTAFNRLLISPDPADVVRVATAKAYEKPGARPDYYVAIACN